MTPSEIEEEKKLAASARDEWRKLMRAYAGFQMATALVVAAKASDVCGAAWIISLFAVSIPSTIALAGLVRLTKEDEARNPAPIFATCWALAFLPSIAALSMLIWPASHVAALIFPAMSFIWFMVIVRLRTHDSVKAAPK